MDSSPDPEAQEPILRPHTSSSSSVINDGAVAGVLPETEAFAVHYPGYPSSTSRAIQTLGGIAEISKVRSLDSNPMELRFRPEDPYSHPVFGELQPSASLLLKFSKPKKEGDCGISANIVGRVLCSYQFEGMVDYQHVVAVHAAEARSRKRPLDSDQRSDFDSGLLDSDAGDVMMILPPLFSIKDRPEKIVLNPSANLFSKNVQRGVVEHRWEMDIEPCLAIDFNIESVPVKINWEDYIPKESPEWEWQLAVSKLFDERPIWPRWSLYERVLDDGLQMSENHFKRLLFRVGYYFSTGPFGRFWIRKGYDPRKDSESRIYQRVDFRMPFPLRDAGDPGTSSRLKPSWKEIFRFQAFPAKNFVCLQLFELDDDDIQREIKKPSSQTTCTRATGWFSRLLLRILSLLVKVRFLRICPKKGAEDLVESSCELLDRFKKEEANSIFLRLEKVHQHANRGSNDLPEVPGNEFSGMRCENEDPDVPNNCEMDEEEEEEEEQDGYDPFAEAGEDDQFSFDANSYQTRDGVSDDFLQELLRGFPFSRGGNDQQQNEFQASDIGGDEYQIYEQDSDDDD